MTNQKSSNKIKKIAIFSHNYAQTSGWDDEFISYLLAQNKFNIVNIRFPFVASKDGAITINFYKLQEKHSKKSIIRFYRPEVVSYIKDFILGMYYGIKYCRNYDLFVGLNNLLVLVGIVLKKIGWIKKVVYCMIDYTPRRYQNSVLNRIYYFIDRLACEQADVIWPLHQAMIDGRVRDKKINPSKINFFITPSGNNSDHYTDQDYKQNSQFTIIYFGGIVKSKGAELFIPIAKKLLARQITNFKFECIGPGQIEDLKKEIIENNLTPYFKVYGPIEDMKTIEQKLLTYGVAIAPYYSQDKNNFSFYADPGKVKIYLGAGLPIVITDVPPIAKDIVKQQAGLIAEYSATDFADKIIQIWAPQNYSNFRKNAIIMGQRFAWSKIFNSALSHLDQSVDLD